MTPRLGMISFPAWRTLRLALPALLSCILLAAAAACGRDAATGPTIVPPDTTKDSMPAPPSPRQVFDLRFKGAGVLSSTAVEGHADILGSAATLNILTQSNASGTPLELGPGVCSATQCAWFFDLFAIPRSVTGLVAIYRSDLLANLPTLVDTSATDTVITSLDVEPPDSVFAVSKYVTDTVGGYRARQQVVPLADLAAAAAQEGAASRVITAVSFDVTGVRFVSYGWDHDSTTAYDTQVLTAPLGTLGAAAASLAAAGYVVTALGGDSADGYMLVGTRAHGATQARSLVLDPAAGTDLSGYVVVGAVADSLNALTLIMEK